MELRQYQAAAVAALYEHLRHKDTNPVIVIPTGGGKTPVIATVCRDFAARWGKRVLILSHVKELLQQSRDHLTRLDPTLNGSIGVYSAGLGEKDLSRPITIAGIQSLYKLAELPAFDILIVDEVHLVQPSGEGMYRTLLARVKAINPKVRLIGLTATPFRMRSGPICADGSIFQEICYEIGIRPLIAQGFLCRLKSFAGSELPDTDGLHLRAGEFIPSEVAAVMEQEALVHAAATDIIEKTRERRACLVFASSIEHGHMLATELVASGRPVREVYGGTSTTDRDTTVADFRAGEVAYLVNVGVFTTGFDAPNVDTIALVRPTMSPGLYYQMVGRGFRVCPGKPDCLVLDLGNNIIRHGPIDQITVKGKSKNTTPGEAPAKMCPECRALIPTGTMTCPNCGHVFPPREVHHEAKSSDAAILSGEEKENETRAVERVYYSVHTKKDAPEGAPRTMRVEYIDWRYWRQSEWVCFEHEGYARRKAESWWYLRTDHPCPNTAEEAVDLAKSGVLMEPKAITIAFPQNDKYGRIVGYEFDEPEFAPEPARPEDNYEDVPF